MKSQLLTGFAALFLLGNTFQVSAQDKKQFPPSAEDKSPKLVPNGGELKVLTKNCYTNVQGCAGDTTYGAFTYDVGCTVWYNDGANGHSNFTLKAGQKTEVSVRYNDTGACVAIQYAPPNYNNGRFYLYVHN